jgi:hypothetical protein
MKRDRIGKFALSLMTGAIITATSALASSQDAELAYISVYFTNSTQVYYIPTAPATLDGTAYPTAVTVWTDGNGKIDGVANLHVVFRNDAKVVEGTADVIADVNGSITTKGTSVKVTMTLKGGGYATSADGKIDGKSTLNLRFTGVLGTNGIVGTFNGTVVPDVKSINNGKALKLQDSPGVVGSYSERFDFEGKTVRMGKSVYSTGGMCESYYPYVATGGINLKKDTFKATLNGVAQGRGAKVNLVGTTHEVPNLNTSTDVISVPTVTVPDEVFATGKVAGQKITASGSRVSLEW